MIKRHNVEKTDRIIATERLINYVDSSNVLEFGAGDMSFDYLKKPGCNWLKVDFAPPCDTVCDLNTYNLILPFNDATFDLAICTEVLEHLLWPQVFLKEVHRILKSDGQMIVSVPNVVSFSYRIAWLMGHIPSCAATGNLPVWLAGTGYVREMHEEPVGGHVIDFNENRITNLLLVSGFNILKVKGSGIIWHKQLLPYWLVPPSFSSNIICLTKKVND